MLKLVELVGRSYANFGALAHVEDAVSMYLLDFYGFSLVEILQMPNTIALLRIVTDTKRFGKRFDEFQVYEALCEAGARGNLPAVKVLFEYSPSIHEAFVKYPHHCHPLEIAASHGQMQVVTWFFSNYQQCCSHQALVSAAANGHVHVVQFLCAQKLLQKVQEAAKQAASRGHLETVRFLSEQQHIECLDCLMEPAMSAGQVKIVAWLQQQQCDQDAMEICRAEHAAAINNEHSQEPTTSLVQPQRPRRVSIQESQEAVSMKFDELAGSNCTASAALSICPEREAPEEGNEPVQDTNEGSNDLVWRLQDSIRCGRLHDVEHLLGQIRSKSSNSCKKSKNTAANVTSSLFSFDRLLDQLMDAICAASFCGFEPVVEYVLSLHDTLDARGDFTKVVKMAIERKSTSLVRFLHAKQVRGFSAKCMDLAASCGHLSLVQFFHEHRSEGCTAAAIDKAASKGFKQIVEFLHNHRREGCTIKAMDWAAANGQMEMVQFLHANRREGCTKAAIHDAASNGHFEIVSFLLINRHEVTSQVALNEACWCGQFDMVKWLVLNCEDCDYEEALMFAARDLDMYREYGYDKLPIIEFLQQVAPRIRRRRQLLQTM